MADRSIFICYRREDSIAYAGRIWDHLGAHFGRHRVFMDLDAIQPGEDFIDVLERRVGACEALIAVIGKSWVDSRSDDGRRRLEDPEDYVRREIAAALDRRVRVIPALVGGAKMPKSTELPEDISPLARRSAIEISDTAFPTSVAKLIDTLEGVFKGDPAKRYDSDAVPSLAKQAPPEEPTATVVRPSPKPFEERTTKVPLGVALRGRAGALAAVGVVVFIVWAIIAFVSSGQRVEPLSEGVAPTSGAGAAAAPADQGRSLTQTKPAESPVAQIATPGQPTFRVGTVTDVETGRPIAGATVRIDNGSVQTLKSGRQGEFSFTREPTAPASALIQVSATGYLAQSDTIDVTGQSPLLFQLRREPRARIDEPRPTAATPNAAPAPARNAASTAAPMRVGGNIKAPVKTKNVAPIYPAAAQASGVQGVVIVELTIGPKGNVQDARVLRSVPALDQAALDAVRQWEYAPTMLNGAPVAVLATVSVQFRLAPPAAADPLVAYVTRLESAKNVGAAIDLLNKVFHVHAGGWNPNVVFSTLRERIEKATPEQRAAALKIANAQ